MTSRSGGVMLSPVTSESSRGLAFLHCSQMSKRARFQTLHIAEQVRRTCKAQTCALGMLPLQCHKMHPCRCSLFPGSKAGELAELGQPHQAAPSGPKLGTFGRQTVMV